MSDSALIFCEQPTPIYPFVGAYHHGYRNNVRTGTSNTQKYSKQVKLLQCLTLGKEDIADGHHGSGDCHDDAYIKFLQQLAHDRGGECQTDSGD